MDRLTEEKRSWNMSRIKNRDTQPELKVRSILHRMGLRFRLHRKDLPGKPDIVLPKFKKVIFVNGCFWHRHDCKNGKHLPKSNVRFWTEKLEGNKKRDKRNIRELEELGWNVVTVWECQTNSQEDIKRNIPTIFNKSC